MENSNLKKSSCLNCAKEFLFDPRDGKNGLYCSLLCFHEKTRVPIEQSTCKNCQKEFTFKNYRREPRLFCGLTCYYKLKTKTSKHGTGIKKSSCKTCAEGFFYTTSDRSGKYCSLICFHKDNSLPRVTTQCKSCNSSFEFQPIKGKMTREYCDPKCYQKSRLLLSYNIDRIKNIMLNYSEKQDNGCVLWQKSVNGAGYGGILYRGKKMGAHRAMWSIHNGDIPKNMVVAHRCDVKRCIAIEHLFLTTTLGNQQDCMQKNRKPVGIDHKNSKYTEEQIREAKQLIKDGFKDLEIFKKTGVPKATILWVRKGDGWKHITI